MASVNKITEMDSISLKNLFDNMKTIINGYIPQIRDYELFAGGYQQEIASMYFLRLTATLERLMFPEDMENIHTFTSMPYRITQYDIDRILQNSESTNRLQFVCTVSPRTRYDEDLVKREGLKHLEAAETALKEYKNQFLKIFTYKNVFYVYSNKTLSVEVIARLKLLQWTLYAHKLKKQIPEIRRFVEAIQERNIDKINEMANEIINLKMFEEVKYQELMDLFKPDYKGMKRELQRQKDNCEINYQSAEHRMLDLIAQINDLTEQIFDLETKIDQIEDNSELIRYLTKHPYIKDVTKYGPREVKLYYEAPIIYFDDYILKKLIPHKTDEAKRILKVFLDNKYELMTRCQIVFNTTKFKVHFDFIGTGNFIGHPHIDRFNCFGNHTSAILEAAKTGNYFGAIEQISQAVLNLNFTDSAVVNEMINNLRANRYIQTWRSKETGAYLSTEEILEIYNE